jgi:zinc-ribbon domain
MMRCPACGAENPEEAKRCPACGERMARKPRRREPIDDTDSPFTRGSDTPLAPAMRAYRCAVCSLIPIAGLLLGPLAVFLALLAWRQGRRDPALQGNRYIAAALGLGLITLLCNGVGLTLMVMGWLGAP